jgi:lipoprotein NlpD
LLLSVLLTGCNINDDLPEIRLIERVIPYHTVVDGDTVGSIATAYGMTRTDLIKLNGLEPPYQLYNGQRLVISVKPKESNNDDLILPPRDLNDGKDPIPEEGGGTLKTQSLQDSESSILKEELPDDTKKEPISENQSRTEYVWPIKNGRSKISQHFGSGNIEGGITINAPVGTPIRSICDGVVVFSGVPDGEASAYGLTIVIKHIAKKIISIYAGLKETAVSVGRKVKCGGIIGKTGKSGTITKDPKLYFEINDCSGSSRTSIDPEILIKE